MKNTEVRTHGKKTDGENVWIDDLEVDDAEVKWPFSHFDGRKDVYNDEGDHNFTIIIPNEWAEELLKIPNGWAIKEHTREFDGEEVTEYTLKVKISDKYGPPPIYFLKGNRRMKVDDLSDLGDIRRSTCKRLDVIISPSRWVNPQGQTGVTGYVKEMYVQIEESKFAERYADYEDVDASGGSPSLHSELGSDE